MICLGRWDQQRIQVQDQKFSEGLEATSLGATLLELNNHWSQIFLKVLILHQLSEGLYQVFVENVQSYLKKGLKSLPTESSVLWKAVSCYVSELRHEKFPHLDVLHENVEIFNQVSLDFELVMRWEILLEGALNQVTPNQVSNLDRVAK
jgi:hypothetical protein